jgi:hypothetical protein
MPREKKVQERILLYNNFGRKNDVERRLKDVIDVANETVIPICKALGMPLLKPAILKYVADDEALLSDYTNICKRKLGELGRFGQQLAAEAAESDFEAQKRSHPYPRFPGCRQLAPDEEGLLTFDGEVMSYSKEKLTEYTNVYLTDKKGIEGYRRAEELCAFLNEFFRGTQLAPRRDALMEWSRVIFASPTGIFWINPQQDFSKLIKK